MHRGYAVTAPAAVELEHSRQAKLRKRLVQLLLVGDRQSIGNANAFLAGSRERSAAGHQLRIVFHRTQRSLDGRGDPSTGTAMEGHQLTDRAIVAGDDQIWLASLDGEPERAQRPQIGRAHV